MQTAMPARSSWVDRVRGTIYRLLGVGLAYPSSGAPVPTNPSYDVERGEAAIRMNPWAWVSVHAVASDLAGLPIVIERGVGRDRERVPDHPLVDLFDRPHPRMSGVRFRRQVAADFLGGNAYIRQWRRPDQPYPYQLGRIPPKAITPLVGKDHVEEAWTLQDGTVLPWSSVLHLADIALDSDNPTQGSSPVEPLALQLGVDRDSRRQAGRSARRGRLEVMVTPNGTLPMLPEGMSKTIVEGYATATEEGHGIYVVPTGVEATPLSLSARDGEFLALMDRTQREVLATYGVPETRAGSPAANYGTAREQSRIYWQSLQLRAALIDAELSRLALPGERVRHDFSAVDALQPSRTERLNRVEQFVGLGMDATEALRYEGFVDAPALNAGDTASSPFAQVGLPALVGAGILSRKGALRLLGLDDSYAPTPEELAAALASGNTQAAKQQIVSALRAVAQDFADGEDPEELERSATKLLERMLRRLGVAPDRADAVARDAAAVCGETARSHAGGHLVELGAFGAAHADRILRMAGLEAA